MLLVDGPPMHVHPKVLTASKERLRTAENSNKNPQANSPKKKVFAPNAANALDYDH